MGDQMFMYASGLAVASRLGTELRFGAWDWYSNYRHDRPWELSNFPAITERNATFSELWRLAPGLAVLSTITKKPINNYHIFRRLIRKIIRKLRLDTREDWVLAHLDAPFPYPFKFSRVCIQTPTSQSRFNEIPDDTVMVGYWGSEKYFAGISDIICNKFRFPDNFFDPILSTKIRSSNSIALHVRRGDKVNNNRHRPSDERYIRIAIEKICSLTDNPKFFVFGDDMNWNKKTLPQIYDAEYTFVEGNTPPQDMALMTICKHVIMGPSTFSWWGSWLNVNPKKIIIAPDNNLWVVNPSKTTRKSDFLPDRWIKISQL